MVQGESEGAAPRRGRIAGSSLQSGASRAVTGAPSAPTPNSPDAGADARPCSEAVRRTGPHGDAGALSCAAFLLPDCTGDRPGSPCYGDLEAPFSILRGMTYSGD